MSLDTFVSTAMLLGGLLLMMRFGCGAHMGSVHTRKMSDPGRPGETGAPSTKKGTQK